MVLFGLSIFFLVVLIIALISAKMFRSSQKNYEKLEADPEIKNTNVRGGSFEGDINDAATGKVWSFIVAGIVGFFFVACLLGASTKVVPANSVGIPTSFGSIGKPMKSGFHLTKPWTEVNNFSTRLQESSMLSSGEGEKGRQDSISVRGSDGYEMWVDVTIRYTIAGDTADQLFRRVGSMDGIKDRIVRPEVREGVRLVFANYTAEEGYSAKREDISKEFNALLKSRLAPYGVILDSAVIRSVDPDETLKKAISDRSAARERGLQAELEQKKQVTEAETRKQVAERDATALTTKTQGEADAQRIAAQGEADANAKVSASLTEAILRQLQIEALKAGTVYVVPDGGNFILGDLKK